MADTRKDAIVSRQSSDERAKIEAKRGIVRDEEGKIVRSKEWTKARLEHLKEKRKDFETRVDNIDEEIATRKSELKNLG